MHMVNQQKIIPMGCLHGLTVDIEDARAVADFKFIEIINNNNPYPTLFWIDWAFDMNAIINLKKWSMVFEKNELWVISPWNQLKVCDTHNQTVTIMKLTKLRTYIN